MADISVLALMTVVMGIGDKKQKFSRGTVFSVNTVEAERLLRVGAVSISGEVAPLAPLPSETQPTGNMTGKKSDAAS